MNKFMQIIKRSVVSLRQCLLLFVVAMPIASADVMVVTLLGTGTPRPEADRGSAAVLVEAGNQKLLFDAGRDVARRIYQLGLDYNTVDKLFITHLHYDHIIGLPDLMLSGWVFQRTQPIRLWGPTGSKAHVEQIQKAYHTDINLRKEHTHLSDEGIRIEVREITEGIVYAEQDLTVKAILVDHGVVKPAFGYRVDYKGRSLVISGDTRYSENLVEHAKGVDLLIHEIADASDTLLKNNERLRKVLDYHTRPAELSRLLQQTNPRQTVLVHALIFGKARTDVLSEIRSQYEGEVIFGEDLTAFDIGDHIRMYRRDAL
ncbi:MAG: MBL fold metallo-hydrolase [Chromatiales bacterium]|nr:MBL fold metallo-hydrolase [Chromatiales bacterium]